MTARVEWLTVGGPVGPWERLGFVVVDGLIPLFGTGIRIDPAAPPGLCGWSLSGVADDLVSIDGVPTTSVPAASPILVEHPIGAIGLDHVVVATDSLERTCTAVEVATGAPLRRTREVGDIRQGFHRVGGGGLIVEVVEHRATSLARSKTRSAHARLASGPASLWGFVVLVEDLEGAVGRIGPDAIGVATPAVQPGRSIATVRESAGHGVPLALMSPE